MENTDTLIAAAFAGGFAGALALAYGESRAQRFRTEFAQELAKLNGVLSQAGHDLVQWLADLSDDTKKHIRSVLGSNYSATASSQIFLDRVEAEEILKEADRFWVTKPNDMPPNKKWEDCCVSVLADSLHLLFPEFEAQSRIYLDQQIQTFLKDELGVTADDIAARQYDLKFKVPQQDRKPDLLAGVRMTSRVSSVATRRMSPVIFLVEAKTPDAPVTKDVMDEAFNYAYDIWRLWQPPQHVHFECLAVGKELAPGVGPMASLEFGKLATISITPVTWNDLRERIKRYTRIEPRLRIPHAIERDRR